MEPKDAKEEAKVPNDVSPVEKGVVKENQDQVDKIIDKANKKISKAEGSKVRGDRENIVNYVPEPRVDDPEFDIKSWAKKIEDKVDEILNSNKKSKHKDDEVKEKPQLVKKSDREPKWYDQELF